MPAINALAHDLCSSIGAATVDIVDVAICGNTAMHHLLLGLPVRQLGRAPFVAAIRDAIDIKARELDLTVCPGAYVHFAPNIGGYVGSDHVTALHPYQVPEIIALPLVDGSAPYLAWLRDETRAP